MAKLPLSQTVDASMSQTSWRSSIISLVTSTAVQLLTIAILVAAPLLVAQTLPEPTSRLTLPKFVPVAVQLPIESRPDTPADTKPTNDANNPTHGPPVRVDWNVPPTVILDEIPDADSYFSEGDLLGVPGGLPSDLGGPRSTPLSSTPSPYKEDSGPIPLTGELQPPKKVVHVNPIYPPMARAARIEGTVSLQAIIDIDGKVSNLSVIKSVTLLDGAAIEAVRQWRYEPTRLNGRAVAVIMTVEVTFHLR